MARGGARIGVLGATGALGGEVLAALDASRVRVAEILPLATHESLGAAIEFQGNDYPVLDAAEAAPLRGLDGLFLCAPAPASLEYARQALRAAVPCIDCSGALQGSSEVPLRIAHFPAPPGSEGTPLLAAPAGALLPWALVLRPLHERAGVRRVTGAILEAASAAGRQGIEALHAESVALFNQSDPPDPRIFGRPLAFDCWPDSAEPDEGGRTPRERALGQGLERLLSAPVLCSATAVQVPAFLGLATALRVETASPLDAKQARELLARAPGVDLWPEPDDGPSLRAAAGRDAVLVGGVRADPSSETGLTLWLVADVLRLAAANAVELVMPRLRPH